jgi:ferric-dicitrate binding protein FerR (iron transport regulator)
MNNSREKLEEIMLDEQFLSWYYKTDLGKSQQWEERRSRGEVDTDLLAEAMELMEQLNIKEAIPSRSQIAAAEAKLWEQLEQQEMLRAAHAPAKLVAWYRKPLQIAAVLVLVVVAGWLVNSYLNPGVQAYQTGSGEVATITLEDGTELTLNGNTKLNYRHPDLFRKSREVWLEGEAFFKVQPKPDKQAFIVHLEQLDIHVTGTEFNAYQRPHKTEVLLTEGSVTLTSGLNRDTLHLQPGELAKFENGKIHKVSGNTPQLIGWKERKFIFENTSLEEVARSMEALFGIEVRLEGDTTSQMTISAILPSDNLDTFIQSLEATQEFSVKRNGKLVVIGPAVR